jgi:hypothetical protein
MPARSSTPQPTVTDPDANTRDAEVELRLLIAADAPKDFPQRWSLTGLRLVEIGRGDEFDAHERPVPQGGGVGLVLRIPDKWLSARHAQLVLAAGDWFALDKGSKNGTWVNGGRVERAPLGQSAVIQVGRTWLAFSTEKAAAEEDPLATTLRMLFREHGGNLSAVARAIGKDRKQVRRWLDAFKLR